MILHIDIIKVEVGCIIKNVLLLLLLMLCTNITIIIYNPLKLLLLNFWLCSLYLLVILNEIEQVLG